MEYLAFIDLMSGMNEGELELLLSYAQKYRNAFSVACEVSEVMRIASERYLVIAQMEAELTIFDEHSKYEYDEEKITNELSRAFLIYYVVGSFSGSARKYVDIFHSEDGTYVAKLTVSFDATGNAGEAIAADMSGETITIYPWKENKILQGYLNDCERVSFCALDSSMGEVLKDATISEVTGYIWGKIGNVTIDEFGGLLSYSASAANLVLDMKENYERTVTIKGGLTIIDIRETVDALGINGGVISVAGGYESTVQIIFPKYDMEELYVRVQAYNNANAEKENFVEITVDELKDAFSNEGELLQDYVHWYWKEGGAADVDEHWRELTDIVIEYKGQNMDIILEDPENMNIEQIQELIKKKNDPNYQINTEIMQGE